MDGSKPLVRVWTVGGGHVLGVFVWSVVLLQLIAVFLYTCSFFKCCRRLLVQWARATHVSLPALVLR